MQRKTGEARAIEAIDPLADLQTLCRRHAWDAELVSLHLLKALVLDVLITTFHISGSNAVESALREKACLDQHRTILWQCARTCVGISYWRLPGVQKVAQRLARGRELSGEDKTHYAKIAVALKEAIRLMEEDEIVRWLAQRKAIISGISSLSG